MANGIGYLLLLLGVGGYFTANTSVLSMRRSLFDHQGWNIWPGIISAILIHLIGRGAGLFSHGRPIVWWVYMGMGGVMLFSLFFYYRLVMKRSLTALGLSWVQLPLQLVLGLRWIIGYFIIGNVSVYLFAIFFLKVLDFPQVFETLIVRQRQAMEGSVGLLALVEAEWGAAFLWIPVVYLVLVGPILEELVFRGLLYGPMRRQVGPVFAALMTAFLFMLGHGQIAQSTFVFGLLFAYLYESTQSLVPSILFHVLINLRSLELYFAHEVSLSPTGMMAEAGWRSLFYALLFSLVAAIHWKMIKKGHRLHVPVSA